MKTIGKVFKSIVIRGFQLDIYLQWDFFSTIQLHNGKNLIETPKNPKNTGMLRNINCTEIYHVYYYFLITHIRSDIVLFERKPIWIQKYFFLYLKKIIIE